MKVPTSTQPVTVATSRIGRQHSLDCSACPSVSSKTSSPDTLEYVWPLLCRLGVVAINEDSTLDLEPLLGDCVRMPSARARATGDRGEACFGTMDHSKPSSSSIRCTHDHTRLDHGCSVPMGEPPA